MVFSVKLYLGLIPKPLTLIPYPFIPYSWPLSLIPYLLSWEDENDLEFHVYISYKLVCPDKKIISCLLFRNNYPGRKYVLIYSRLQSFIISIILKRINSRLCCWLAQDYVKVFLSLKDCKTLTKIQRIDLDTLKHIYHT